MDERALRQKIVGKYGYVDQEDDARYHRPIIKKEVNNCTKKVDNLVVYLGSVFL